MSNPPFGFGKKNSENEMILRLVKALESMNRPVPISFQSSSPEAEAKLKEKINKRLNDSRPLTSAFPNCTDVLLSLIKTTDSDDITGFFTDYFKFCDHQLLADTGTLNSVLDPSLTSCTGKWFSGVTTSPCDGNVIRSGAGFPPDWPPFWCFPPTCVSLAGKRHLYADVPVPADTKLRRLFIGDLVWLFYFERLGVLQILSRILDDYAFKGNYPISNGSLDDVGSQDDVVAVVLEAMARQTETGGSSKRHDRHSSYQRGLGWKLPWQTPGEGYRTNTEFSHFFHQFIVQSLDFYNDKRLAVAIRSTASPTAQPSTETLTAISVTLGELKKTLERFHYGRTYNNTLSGIVWVLGGMALIGKLREDLGIPRAYGSPDEYIPAVYNRLFPESKRKLETGSYENHKICAERGRDILLDIEMIDHTDSDIGGELDLWLNIIESKVGAYRIAYKSLTGLDLGAKPTPLPEQAI